MPILWPLRVPERGNARTQRKTLEIDEQVMTDLQTPIVAFIVASYDSHLEIIFWL